MNNLDTEKKFERINPDLEQIPTDKEIVEIATNLEKEGKSLGDLSRIVKIPPSKRSILQLPKDLLLKHNALIFHKSSSLSSSKRKHVQERVAYGIKRGTIKPEEVAKEINILNALIMGELKKVTMGETTENTGDADSSTEQ